MTQCNHDVPSGARLRDRRRESERAAHQMYAGLITAVIVGAMLVFSSVACDPGHGVTFENQTDKTLAFFEYGRPSFTMQPHEKKTYTFISFAEAKPIEARDESGTVVFSKALTWAELKGMDWKITIPNDSIPAD